MSSPHCDKPLSGVGRRQAPGGLRSSRRWFGAVAATCLAAAVVVFHGCGRREIIRPTPQMDIGSEFWVRVLLAAEATECTVGIPSAFRVEGPDSSPGPQAGQAVTPPHAPTKIRLTDGRLMFGATPLPGREVIIRPDRPHVFNFNGQDYRGRLALIVNGDGRTFDAINLVPLEPYLAGVVGAEMPDYWEPQALRAQAIAARTYCLYIKSRFGANRRWDVSRTQANQVYGGIEAESAQTWSAVSSTHGKILTVRGPRLPTDGRPVGTPNLVPPPFPAYYSSICGGHTADSREVFGDPDQTPAAAAVPEGVPCPYCRDVAKLSLFFWPMARFERQTATDQLVRRYPNLAALGPIREIVVAEKSDYGRFSRATRVRLVGQTGSAETLRAEDLRLALDPSGRKIRSTACQIVPWGDGWAFLAGRGWGHGVGMCQCGAEGMARLGNDAEAILRYYYPGCEIVSIY